MPKLNLFSPSTAGADRAEISSGALEMVNVYVDQVGKKPVFKTRPGLTELHDNSQGGRVDLYWWEAKRILIAAGGKKIYAKLKKNQELVDITPTDSADIFPLNSRVFFSADEYGVTMSAGQHMLWWGGSTSVKAARITDANAPSPITALAYLKGYTIASEQNSQAFYYATYGPEDAKTSPPPWNPLFLNASAAPDDIITLGAGWEELFILGRESTQSHYVSGDTDIPFPALSGSVGETGILGARTLQKLGNTWFFLSSHKQVVRMNGRTPEVISSSIDQELRRLTYFDRSEAFTLFNRFYVLNFTVDHTTFVYDITNGLWYRWEAWNRDLYRFKRWNAISSAMCKSWGQQLIGSFDGKIYLCDHDVATDGADAALIRVLIRSGQIDHDTSQTKFVSDMNFRLRRGDRNG